MNKQFKYYLQLTLIVLDFVVLNIVFLVSGFFFEEKIAPIASYSYAEFWLVQNFFWILIALGSRTYSDNNIINFENFTKRTVQV
jgi:hypothetical protein